MFMIALARKLLIILLQNAIETKVIDIFHFQQTSNKCLLKCVYAFTLSFQAGLSPPCDPSVFVLAYLELANIFAKSRSGKMCSMCII